MNSWDKLSHSLKAAVSSSLGELFWYALMAASVWLTFYVLFRHVLRRRRISTSDPTARQVLREIGYSLRSIVIFGLVTIMIVYAALSGWTRLYIRVSEFGWNWYVFSIVAMVIIHDTYFYWTHRLMHHRRLFRFFHRTHHLSNCPTPWAAYAFSPAEALVQAGIAPLIIFALPVHPSAFAAFMLWQISFNVFGHCGYEIFPASFLRSPFGRVLNTVPHHGLHHEKYQANFGLYFNVWDRLLGTNHRDYERRFDLATARACEAADLPFELRRQSAVTGE